MLVLERGFDARTEKSKNGKVETVGVKGVTAGDGVG